MLTAIINFEYGQRRIADTNLDEINKIISMYIDDQQQMDEVAELSKQIDLRDVFILAKSPVCVPDDMLVFGCITDPEQRGKNITTTDVFTRELALANSTGRRYFADYGINKRTAFDYSDYEDKIFELSVEKPIIVKFKRRMRVSTLAITEKMSTEDMKYYLDNIDTNILRISHDTNQQGLEFYRGDTLIIVCSTFSVIYMDIIFANKNIKHVVMHSRYNYCLKHKNIEDCDLLSFYPHVDVIAAKIAENVANLANSRFKKMKPIMSSQD